ncbi:MAG: 23S rRNA (adenine(1618)-N(6))-methyltransferase RlmF [Bacteroidota bacterium]
MAAFPSEKHQLHRRNKHRSQYDFEALIRSCPALSTFVKINKYGNESIDFADPNAVKMLNKALLQHFYQIDFWDIPDGYLCPPIPGRADYMHYAADLLASSNRQVIPTGRKIKILDVGVGANCIYPIIGHQEYGWSFVGSDIDQIAVRVARNTIAMNPFLKQAIEIRLQPSKLAGFKNIIHHGEHFDLTICNPPFHASAEVANAGSLRKNRNLGARGSAKQQLNFGGRPAELWTTGGEVAFVGKLIEESNLFREQCFWFSSLVSKSEHLPELYYGLKKAGVFETRTLEMAQGNKISRVIAWTFLDLKQQQDWQKKYWEPIANK